MSQLLDILRDHKSRFSKSMEGISGEKDMIVNIEKDEIPLKTMDVF